MGMCVNFLVFDPRACAQESYTDPCPEEVHRLHVQVAPAHRGRSQLSDNTTTQCRNIHEEEV